MIQPEVFQVDLFINPLQFDTMMREDDVKKYFKEKLAYSLAQKIIETNRAEFTYNRQIETDMIILKAKVRL
mgnify:CR=1 FL=1